MDGILQDRDEREAGSGNGQCSSLNDQSISNDSILPLQPRPHAKYPLPMSAAPLKEILLKLCRREDLTRSEARDAFLHLMSGDASDAQIGGLLVGLAAKGTTVEELVGAAQVMREKVLPIPCAADGVLLDTCGTGGGGPRARNAPPPPPPPAP